MDSRTARKLFQGLDKTQSEEAIKIITTAHNDPDAARSLWNVLLSAHTSDERFHTALQWVLESAIIDYIANHVDSNDEYALVIGQRIVTILEALSQPEREERAKAA